MCRVGSMSSVKGSRLILGYKVPFELLTPPPSSYSLWEKDAITELFITERGLWTPRQKGLLVVGQKIQLYKPNIYSNLL